MLQQEPTGRPSAKDLLEFFEKTVDEAEKEFQVFDPKGGALGATTTIFNTLAEQEEYAYYGESDDSDEE